MNNRSLKLINILIIKDEIFKPQHMRAISNNSSLYMYIKISKPILKQRFYIYIPPPPTHKSLNFKSDWFIFMKNNFRPRHSNFNFIQRQRSPYNIDMAPKYLTFCATFFTYSRIITYKQNLNLIPEEH